jgi:hypothetical protein
MSARKARAGRNAQRQPTIQSAPAWPALGRKGCRKARKQLIEAMEQSAGRALSLSFNESFAESHRLQYPNSTYHFLRMWMQAVESQMVAREKGSGISR